MLAVAEDPTPVPVRLIVLGRPGSGKGTQGTRLARILGVPHVSTGDLLRSEIEDDRSRGRTIAASVTRGEMVSDDVVGAVLSERLARSDARNLGFVLDGYPRTIPQAVTLERLVAPAGLSGALELVLPEREAAHRLLTRFVCTECGHSSARSRDLAGPTSRGGGDDCPRCRGPLRRRADDEVTVIRRRFADFVEGTKPLLEWLDRRGLLVSVDASRPPDSVTEAALDALTAVLDRAGVARQGA